MIECPILVGGGGGSTEQLGIYPIGTDGRPIGDVIVPEGVTSLANSLFYKDAFTPITGITSISIPSTCTTIGTSSCRYMSDLTEVIFCGNNLISIGSYSFMACNSLLSITLPDGLQTIYDYAFAYINLQTIHLPATLINISNEAFESDSSLANVTVGSGFDCNLNISSCSTITASTINGIITNYKDNSATGVTRTLMIGTTNLAKLTEDNIAVATAKNLTLA